MKRLRNFALSLVSAALLIGAVAGAAQAADTGPNGEKAGTSMTLTPNSGSFYQGGDVPASWRINVEVTEEYEAMDPPQDIFPLKKVGLKLPTDMTFHPNPNMPVCGPDNDQPGDAARGMDEATNMSVPPQTIIKRCPNSVIGNGSARLYLAHKNLPDGPGLKDPVLVVFNAGLSGSGLPKIKIYGYSKGTGAGIFMQGELQTDGTLEISVPMLTYDSAVADFNLNIPGKDPIIYNQNPVPESVGQDASYVRARCSTGSWLLTSVFTLGTRQELPKLPDGTPQTEPTSPDYLVDAPDVTLPCDGLPGKPPSTDTGKPKIGKVTVKGAASAKKGKTVTYKVTVKNTGKAAATGVKVSASGKGAKGSANGGTIAAGKSKVVKVKVKFKTKGKIKVTFKATGKSAGTAKAVKTVKVK